MPAYFLIWSHHYRHLRAPSSIISIIFVVVMILMVSSRSNVLLLHRTDAMPAFWGLCWCYLITILPVLRTKGGKMTANLYQTLSSKFYFSSQLKMFHSICKGNRIDSFRPFRRTKQICSWARDICFSPLFCSRKAITKFSLQYFLPARSELGDFCDFDTLRSHQLVRGRVKNWPAFRIRVVVMPVMLFFST